MGARFDGVSLRRKTVSWSWCVVLGGAFSCSVFPDEATLPDAAGEAGAGTAGSSSGLVAGGVGGEAPDPVALGGTGGAAASAAGSSAVVDAAGAPPLGAGGMGGAEVGAGGAAACANPQERVLAVTADTWIEAAKPSASHGNDSILSVVGGGQERRALLQVTLPAAVAGAVLLNASLVLHLQANADVGLVKRKLRVHVLAQQVTESRATWDNWSNGNKGKWLMPGGDFGPVVAQAALPARTAEGALAFDVTEAVRSALMATPIPLSLILLESSAPPAAPAELAFTSREGDASDIPALILQYCQP